MLSSEQIIAYQSEIEKLTLSDKKCQKNVKPIISNIAAAVVSLPYMYKVRCEK